MERQTGDVGSKSHIIIYPTNKKAIDAVLLLAAMKSHVYLTFDGNCAEAFNFYKQVFKVDYSHFLLVKDSGVTDVPEDAHDKVMHCSIPLGTNMDLMGCDLLPMHKRGLSKGSN